MTQSSQGSRCESLDIQRILQIKRGNEISQCQLILRGPGFEHSEQRWRTEVECEVFGCDPFKVYGEDSFQSLLLALRLTKAMVTMAIKDGVQVYWLQEGDECGLNGIEHANAAE